MWENIAGACRPAGTTLPIRHHDLGMFCSHATQNATGHMAVLCLPWRETTTSTVPIPEPTTPRSKRSLRALHMATLAVREKLSSQLFTEPLCGANKYRESGRGSEPLSGTTTKAMNYTSLQTHPCRLEPCVRAHKALGLTHLTLRQAPGTFNVHSMLAATMHSFLVHGKAPHPQRKLVRFKSHDAT